MSPRLDEAPGTKGQSIVNSRQQSASESEKGVHRATPGSEPGISQDNATTVPAVHPRKGGHLTPSMVLGMQSLYGNRYVQRAIAAQRAATSRQIQRDDDDSGGGGGYAGDSGFYGSTDQGGGDFAGDSGFNGSTDQGGGDFGGDAGFYGMGDQSSSDAWGSSGSSNSTNQGSDSTGDTLAGEGSGNAAGDNATSQSGENATDPNSGDSSSWQSEEGVAKQDASDSVSNLHDNLQAEAQAQKDLDAASKTGDPAATQDALQNMLAAMVNKMASVESMSAALEKLNQIQQGNKGQWSSG